MVRRFQDLGKLCFVLLWLASCREEVLYRFEIGVVNQNHKPIPDALVEINGHKSSLTNASGQVNLKLKAFKEDPLWLRISKSSPTHSYSVCKMKLDLTQPLKKPLSCLLYSVAKPDTENLIVQKDLVITSLENEISKDLKPASSRLAAEQSAIKNHTASVQEKVFSTPAGLGAGTELEDPGAYPYDLNEIHQQQRVKSYIAELLAWKDHSDPVYASNLSRYQKEAEPVRLVEIWVRDKFRQNSIAGAEIYANHLNQDVLTEGCVTARNGRCKLKMKDARGSRNIFLYIKAKGYKTLKMRLSGQTASVNLVPGATLDILAHLPRFGHLRGVSGVDSYLGRKKLSTTDVFGVSIVDLSKDFLGQQLILKDPRSQHYRFSSLFDTNSLKKGALVQAYFSRPSSHRWVFSLAQPLVSSRTRFKSQGEWLTVSRHLNQQLNKKMASLLRKDAMIATESLTQSARFYRQRLNQIYMEGWKNRLPYLALDFLFVPVVDRDEKNMTYLSLYMIDRMGNVRFGSRKKVLGHLDHGLSWAAASQKIFSVFDLPWSGNVVKVLKNTAVIALESSQTSGRVKVGQEIGIYHVGTPRRSPSVSKSNIKARVVALLSPNTVEIGLDSALERGIQGAKVEYIPHPGDIGVEGSQIRDQSLTFDRSGRLVSGHSNLPKQINKRKVQSHWVQLETQPSAAKVYIEGEYYGKTPYQGFIFSEQDQFKLDLVAPAGYQDISTLIHRQSRQGLNYTGDSKIYFSRQRLPAVKSFMQAAKYGQADSILVDALADKNSLEYPQALFLSVKSCLLQSEVGLQTCILKLKQAYKYFLSSHALLVPSVELAYAFSLIMSKLSGHKLKPKEVSWAVSTITRWSRSELSDGQPRADFKILTQLASFVGKWGKSPNSPDVLADVSRFLVDQNLIDLSQLDQKNALTVSEKISMMIKKSFLSVWNRSGEDSLKKMNF